MKLLDIIYKTVFLFFKGEFEEISVLLESIGMLDNLFPGKEKITMTSSNPLKKCLLLTHLSHGLINPSWILEGYTEQLFPLVKSPIVIHIEST